jgi:hypothetical protein
MNVTLAVTVSGDAILAATMVVFLLQARYMTRSTRSTVYQTVADQMMSIDRLFVEHPELRQYFYGNGLPPAEVLDRERVAAATELLVDFMDNVTKQARQIPEYLSGTWEKYFRTIASTSPSLRAFWSEHRDWYDAALQRVLDPACLIDEQVMRIPARQQADDPVAGR